jgi:hypothetical protein
MLSLPCQLVACSRQQGGACLDVLLLLLLLLVCYARDQARLLI